MGTVLLLVLFGTCLLAPLLGRDSRPRDERDRRGWMPLRRAPR